MGQLNHICPLRATFALKVLADLLNHLSVIGNYYDLTLKESQFFFSSFFYGSLEKFMVYNWFLNSSLQKDKINVL